MSMALYRPPCVYQSTWIEMKEDIAMRHDVDHDNDLATLYFGNHDEYVITIAQDNLDQLLTIGAAAKQALANPPADDQ